MDLYNIKKSKLDIYNILITYIVNITLIIETTLGKHLGTLVYPLWKFHRNCMFKDYSKAAYAHAHCTNDFFTQKFFKCDS